ncbi:MAG: PIN domain-containing protein [Candidatus Hadarchaeaceae archaeon]|nr:nucleotide-binding protein [Hadesarchaea archaeon]MDH5684943.1 nucleotide-binding protein [Hadesarchaea archaeon]
MQVIADTSFLMIPGMFSVDIVGELDRLLEQPHELVITSPVLQELRRISERGKPKEQTAAKIGLILAKRGKVTKVKGAADKVILKLAIKGGYVVGTTDAALRKELRRCGVPVIYLRQKSHLAIDGWIQEG